MLHLDGEPLREGRQNPDCPRPCVLCDTHHHWLDECADEGEPIQVCKHCDAWRPYPDDEALGAPPTTDWEAVGPGMPLNAWLETRREGETGTNLCFCRIVTLGDDPEWVDQEGRTTVTHHSFAVPTHWRWPAKS